MTICRTESDGNRCAINCQGSMISGKLNGQLVANTNLDQSTEVGKTPDGTANKFNPR